MLHQQHCPAAAPSTGPIAGWKRGVTCCKRGEGGVGMTVTGGRRRLRCFMLMDLVILWWSGTCPYPGDAPVIGCASANFKRAIAPQTSCPDSPV